MSTICLICKSDVKNGFILCNGSEIHNECITKIKNNLNEINNKIYQNNLRIDKAEILIKNKVKQSNTISYTLKSIIGLAEKITYEEYQLIEKYKSENQKLSLKINDIEKSLTEIYDYWPTYPPDWEKRRKTLVTLLGKACSRCSSNFQHVHHIISITQGGNHKLSNLEQLCTDCHSRLHKRDFDTEIEYSYYSGNNYLEKLKFIKKAITERRTISFNYTKYEGEKCFRTILPNTIKEVGKYDSVCVEGFCLLRKEDRAFRISRMKNLTIK